MRRERKQSIQDKNLSVQWLNDYMKSGHGNPRVQTQVLQSTKLQRLIFRSFLNDDPEFQAFLAGQKSVCPFIEELALDVFVAFFSVNVSFTEAPRKDQVDGFNHPVIQSLLRDASFDKVKAQWCQNREYPSYHACKAFCTALFPTLQESGKRIDTIYLPIIDLLEQQSQKLLFLILDTMNTGGVISPKRFLRHINRLKEKQRQLHNLRQKVKCSTARLSVMMGGLASQSLQKAEEAAQETFSLLTVWGKDGGNIIYKQENKELLDHVKQNATLMEIAKLLGKYRQILAHKRRTSFSYGLGEKYDVTLGKDIDQCLSSEMALLGTKETQILFQKKYLEGKLLQYRKRAPVVKGAGDMIVLVDESQSMHLLHGWAKAVALALLDIAAKGNRKYAMIHFASKDQIETDRFDPGRYSVQDTMRAAEHFFDGGTDFESPLREALNLIENGYDDADIVIITDGQCNISDDFAKCFAEQKQLHRVTLTGILLDAGRECGTALLPFCDTVYHSSNFTTDQIARQILSNPKYL